MSVLQRIRTILAKASGGLQFDLWGNLPPQSNPDLMPKKVQAKRDGKTYMTTVYVRKDGGQPTMQPAAKPAEPTPAPAATKPEPKRMVDQARWQTAFQDAGPLARAKMHRERLNEAQAAMFAERKHATAAYLKKYGDDIIMAIGAGRRATIRTPLRHTPLEGHRGANALRYEYGGSEMLLNQGGKWVALTEGQLSELADQLDRPKLTDYLEQDEAYNAASDRYWRLHQDQEALDAAAEEQAGARHAAFAREHFAGDEYAAQEALEAWRAKRRRENPDLRAGDLDDDEFYDTYQAPEPAAEPADDGGIRIGDRITDGLVTGEVIGEGAMGNRRNPLPAWRIRIIGGHENGNESLMLKDTPGIRRAPPPAPPTLDERLAAADMWAPHDLDERSPTHTAMAEMYLTFAERGEPAFGRPDHGYFERRGRWHKYHIGNDGTKSAEPVSKDAVERARASMYGDGDWHRRIFATPAAAKFLDGQADINNARDEARANAKREDEKRERIGRRALEMYRADVDALAAKVKHTGSPTLTEVPGRPGVSLTAAGHAAASVKAFRYGTGDGALLVHPVLGYRSKQDKREQRDKYAVTHERLGALLVTTPTLADAKTLAKYLTAKVPDALERIQMSRTADEEAFETVGQTASTFNAAYIGRTWSWAPDEYKQRAEAEES